MKGVLLRAVPGGKHLSGRAVMARFCMKVKNDYNVIGFLVEDSTVLLTSKQLKREFDEELNCFLMDYANADSAFTGEIVARILNRKEVQKALEAYEMYSPSMPYPEGYKDRLLRALEVTPEAEDPVQITVEQLPE